MREVARRWLRPAPVRAIVRNPIGKIGSISGEKTVRGYSPGSRDISISHPHRPRAAGVIDGQMHAIGAAHTSNPPRAWGVD